MEIRTTRAVARLAGGLAVAVIGVVWAMPPGANAQVDLQPSATVARDRDFGLALFRVAAKEHPKDNFVMSTYSVAEAFSLLSAGANGRTLAQLNKALAGTGHVDHGLRKALRDALLAPAPAGLDSAQIAVAKIFHVGRRKRLALTITSARIGKKRKPRKKLKPLLHLLSPHLP